MQHLTTRFILTGVLIFFFFTYVYTEPVNAQLPLPRQIIKTSRQKDSAALIRTSDLIVYTSIGTRSDRWPINRRISAHQTLFNARQQLQIKRVLKGSLPPSVYLLTTGVDPLPRPGDPLNSLYTGPLADGEFLLFLKSYNVKPYYTLNGGFSAVYPIINGKTVVLEDEGFGDFGGKTEAELADLLR